MRTKMALEDNRARCRLRQRTVDRGPDEAEGEWPLVTPAHNGKRLHNGGRPAWPAQSP